MILSDESKIVRDGRIKSTKTEYSERKIQITTECKIGLEILFYIIIFKKTSLEFRKSYI